MTIEPTPHRYRVDACEPRSDPRRMAMIRDVLTENILTVTTEDEARHLIAQLTAWLDVPRLAEPAHICGQCQKPAPSPAATCRDHQWIGVDLDGTLAHHDTWRGLEHIGAPVPAMLARVKRWRARGVGVRIMTARVSDDAQAEAARRAIEAWCLEHVGEALPVTCVKDMHMTELWDDRAVTVEKNAGRPVRDPEAPTIHDALGVTPREAARAAMAHGIPCPTCGTEEITP